MKRNTVSHKHLANANHFFARLNSYTANHPPPFELSYLRQIGFSHHLCERRVRIRWYNRHRGIIWQESSILAVLFVYIGMAIEILGGHQQLLLSCLLLFAFDLAFEVSDNVRKIINLIVSIFIFLYLFQRENIVYKP